MAFLRNSNRQRFTVIDNSAIRDDDLSLKALGLLTKLLSFPDNWEFSENGLDVIFKKDGQASIRSGLKELEDFGYLRRNKIRDKMGRITKVEWDISEAPHLGKPLVENPQVDNPQVDNPSLENPHLENRPQLNTNTSITKKPSTKEHNTCGGKQRFSPPSREDVAAYCFERKNSVDPGRFMDYYAANGWMVGKNRMKDWKATVRNWERKDKEKSSNPFLEMLEETQT